MGSGLLMLAILLRLASILLLLGWWLLVLLLGLLACAVAGGIAVGVVYTAAFVGSLSAGSVPLELVLAHELFHCITSKVLAVIARLSDTWSVANNIALVLGEAGAAEVLMTGHIWKK